MRTLLIVPLVLLGIVAMRGSSAAFTHKAVRSDRARAPATLSSDCWLTSGNLCAGWIWVFNDVQGAVWGTVLDPQSCVGPWPSGGVDEIDLYSRCSSTPAQIGGVGISSVDGVGCRTTLLWQSPPVTVVNCVSGDRWTVIRPAGARVGNNPFAVTVTWGPGYTGFGTSSNAQLATDNGIANLYCRNNPTLAGVFPGCATSTTSCVGWTIPPQRTYIYVTDLNGDGTLDDVCALYGQPYPLAFPYLYPYGYLPNNLIISVGLPAGISVSTRPTTWGHMKQLFD